MYVTVYRVLDKKYNTAGHSICNNGSLLISDRDILKSLYVKLGLHCKPSYEYERPWEYINEISYIFVWKKFCVVVVKKGRYACMLKRIIVANSAHCFT